MASKPAAARRRKTSGGPNIRRKNVNIDQDKLDRLMEFLGARSETEVIDQALDYALLTHEASEGIRKIAGKGGVENYFEGGYSDEWPE